MGKAKGGREGEKVGSMEREQETEETQTAMVHVQQDEIPPTGLRIIVRVVECLPACCVSFGWASSAPAGRNAAIASAPKQFQHRVGICIRAFAKALQITIQRPLKRPAHILLALFIITIIQKSAAAAAPCCHNIFFRSCWRIRALPLWSA